MGGIDVNAGFCFGLEPAAQNTAAWKDEGMGDALLVEDGEAQIAIERCRGNRLPIGMMISLLLLFHTCPVQIDQKALQAFGKLVTAGQKRPALRQFEVKRSIFRLCRCAALGFLGSLIAGPGYGRLASTALRCPTNVSDTHSWLASRAWFYSYSASRWLYDVTPTATNASARPTKSRVMLLMFGVPASLMACLLGRR